MYSVIHFIFTSLSLTHSSGFQAGVAAMLLINYKISLFWVETIYHGTANGCQYTHFLAAPVYDSRWKVTTNANLAGCLT